MTKHESKTTPPSEAAKLLAERLMSEEFVDILPIYNGGRVVKVDFAFAGEKAADLITAHDAEIRREALEDAANAMIDKYDAGHIYAKMIRNLITKPNKDTKL